LFLLLDWVLGMRRFYSNAWPKGVPGSECRTGGWVVGSAVRPLIFFFDLAIFWAKNGLEALYKPLSHVLCCKTEVREPRLTFEYICKDKIMTMIRWRSHCKVKSSSLMEEKCVTNIPIILQNTSRRSKQCQARAKVDNDISMTARLVGRQGEGVEEN